MGGYVKWWSQKFLILVWHFKTVMRMLHRNINSVTFRRHFANVTFKTVMRMVDIFSDCDQYGSD